MESNDGKYFFEHKQEQRPVTEKEICDLILNYWLQQTLSINPTFEVDNILLYPGLISDLFWNNKLITNPQKKVTFVRALSGFFNIENSNNVPTCKQCETLC